MSTTPSDQNNTNRRDFLKTSTVAVGATALAASSELLVLAQQQSGVRAGGSDLIRVGLVGCGGRGTGAAEQCVLGGPNVKLVAMGDAFRDRLDGAHNRLRNNGQIRDRIEVTADKKFVGLDAYRNVIANCDLVILATPPGFRPIHIDAAVTAGKHVFTEKPVAVDGPGARTVLAAFERANQRRLSCVAGTQRRYQTGYLESMRRIHGGDLGTLIAGRCYWNQGSLWHRARTDAMTDVEWQLRNWLYFTWLSGDHICEQHVHNLDVINWATRAHPVKAYGLGGRQVRTGPEFGQIFDHFAVEYEYPNGFYLQSFCRQQEGTAGNISETVAGTRGVWHSPGPASPGHYRIAGDRPWSFNARQQDNLPYNQEHVALIQSIRNGQPINDLKAVAESTLTAIMGRMSCYTGQVVSWEQALNSTENLMPERLTMDTQLPVAPVAMPGRTRLS